MKAALLHGSWRQALWEQVTLLAVVPRQNYVCLYFHSFPASVLSLKFDYKSERRNRGFARRICATQRALDFCCDAGYSSGLQFLVPWWSDGLRAGVASPSEVQTIVPPGLANWLKRA